MFLFDRHELVDRIENLFLDAVASVEFRFADDLIDIGVNALRAAVAISNRVAEDFVVLVEQDEINAPRVNADT